MIDKKAFLEKYNITEPSYKTTGLLWKTLEAIHNNFLKIKDSYEPTAKNISDRLIKLDKVHSVRYRVKDPEHLIAKIIRKKIEDPDCNITLENYTKEMIDIVGVRALHLFKSDWEEIHNFIQDTWDLHKPPVANIRKGDTEEFIKSFREKGCDIREHKYNYRSVHYLIKSNPTKQLNISEIQVRTIFEEGWSEIDHNIRYPYDLNNPIVNEFLMIFNRLAGGADEMGSYIKYLKHELKKREDVYDQKITEQEKMIFELKDKIERLQIKKEEKIELERNLDSILQLSNQDSFPMMNLHTDYIVNEDNFTPIISKNSKEI